VYLENITNSKKDLVGRAQLDMTDQVSPSTGMGGKASTSSFNPYILLIASEKAGLRSNRNVEKIKLFVYTQTFHMFVTKQIIGF
jgi:hypothetical protein